MMKILFISNLYPPNVVGGYERLCFEVADCMAGRNHDVYVLTSSYGGVVDSYPGQKVDCTLKLLADDADIYKPHNLSSVEIEKACQNNNRLVRQAIDSYRPDLIFVWNLFFLNSSIIDSISDSGVKTVFLLTDNWLVSFLNPEFWARYYTDNVLSSPTRLQRVKSVIKKLVIPKSKDRFAMRARAIFPSRFMESLYRDSGFSFSHCAVIPHGVNLPEKSEKDYILRTLPVKNGELSLLFAGRVVRIKGVHTIINAMPQIVNSLPETQVRLTIVGDMSDSGYMDEIKKLMRRHCLEDRIKLKPPVPEHLLFEVFQEHDVYIFPSLYEPFSLTLIHALHSGIPTVASHRGGNPEIIDDGKNGLLFSSEDHQSLSSLVLKLARNPDLREYFSVNARRVNEFYTFSRMIKQIEDYLKV